MAGRPPQVQRTISKRQGKFLPLLPPAAPLPTNPFRFQMQHGQRVPAATRAAYGQFEFLTIPAPGIFNQKSFRRMLRAVYAPPYRPRTRIGQQLPHLPAAAPLPNQKSFRQMGRPVMQQYPINFQPRVIMLRIPHTPEAVGTFDRVGIYENSPGLSTQWIGVAF